MLFFDCKSVLHICGGAENTYHYKMDMKRKDPKLFRKKEFNELEKGAISMSVAGNESQNVFYVAGGTQETRGVHKASETIHRYSVCDDSWIKLSVSLPTGLISPGLAILGLGADKDRFLMVAGGYISSGYASASVHIIDIRENKVIKVPDNFNVPFVGYYHIVLLDTPKSDVLVEGWMRKYSMECIRMNLPDYLLKYPWKFQRERVIHLFQARSTKRWTLKEFDLLSQIGY